MLGGIGHKKLIASCHIAPNLKKHPVDIVGGIDYGIVDGACLASVLVGECKSIIEQFVQFIDPNFFVTNVYATIELGKIDIDPPRVFCGIAKKGRILYNVCINRIFESVGIAGLIKNLVFLLRKIYFEIPPWLGNEIAVAGYASND